MTMTEKDQATDAPQTEEKDQNMEELKDADMDDVQGAGRRNSIRRTTGHPEDD